MEADAPREIVVVDRARAAHLGISQASIAQTLQLALSGFDASYLRDGASKYAVPLRLRLPAGDQASMDALLALRVRAGDGGLVPLSELVRVERADWEREIGRAHARTPGTNAHLVCRLLLEKKNTKSQPVQTLVNNIHVPT